MGIEFPVQDVVMLPDRITKRPGPTSDLRDLTLGSSIHQCGPFGARFSYLTRHVTLAHNISADDQFIESSTEYVMAVLL